MASLMGYDMDRISKPITSAINSFTTAYRERPEVVATQADALSRLADVAEGKVFVS
jgi:hypothetical protein